MMKLSKEQWLDIRLRRILLHRTAHENLIRLESPKLTIEQQVEEYANLDNEIVELIKADFTEADKGDS